MSDLLELSRIYKAEISKLNAEIKLFRDERLDSARSEEMAARLRLENKDLRSALSTAREEGYRAGRLAGLEEAETKIADLNAQASSAWVNPTLADQAYIEGRAECVEIIRSLKAKQP